MFLTTAHYENIDRSFNPVGMQNLISPVPLFIKLFSYVTICPRGKTKGLETLFPVDFERLIDTIQTINDLPSSLKTSSHFMSMCGIFLLFQVDFSCLIFHGNFYVRYWLKHSLH